MDAKLIERAVEFHGHKCGGLMLGLKAGDIALELFSRQQFINGEIKVTMKTKACPTDGMMVSLGIRSDNNTLEIDGNIDHDIILFDIIDEDEYALDMNAFPENVDKSELEDYIMNSPNSAIYTVTKLS